MRKTIIYYTRPCYLDAALEYINVAKVDFDVHVIVQLSPSELQSNIINITSDISGYNVFTPYEVIKSQWNLEFLESYFEGCKSVNFLIFKSGVQSAVKASRTFSRFVRDLNAQHLHFDDFTGKQLFITRLLFRNRLKLILNVHDPKPHSGEFSLSKALIQRLLYSIPRKIVVFSDHSKNLLTTHWNLKAQVFVLRLLPYTVFKHFVRAPKDGRDGFVSFVGRLSPYKGIDIFIDAITSITRVYPNQKFLIAGKALFGYQLDKEKVNKLTANLTVHEQFLTNEEIVSYITNSKVVVCPYLDATQSGVIMAAFALGCPVIVSDVGGLAEYIFEENMGSVTHTNSKDLSDAIISFLAANNDDATNKNTIRHRFELEAISNSKKIKELYS